MRWTASNFMTGMQSIFSKAPSTRGETSLDLVISEIRDAMLDELSCTGSELHAKIQRKIAYANGFQDLWYLRGDVMAALAAVNGEVSARQKIGEISHMFKGYLPPGLVSRPSPFND
jgi:hypothetical protein